MKENEKIYLVKNEPVKTETSVKRQRGPSPSFEEIEKRYPGRGLWQGDCGKGQIFTLDISAWAACLGVSVHG